MSSGTFEIIYLTLKPTMKPEDPANDEGRAFVDAVEALKQQSGFRQTNWGRTLEDENNVVWVVEWRDPTNSVPLSPITPLLAEDSVPISYHATLTPPISREILANCPAVEFVVLAFPSTISVEDKRAVDTDLINFRSSLLDLEKQDAEPPESFSMGWIERPASVQHPDSPSGHASLTVLVIGWGSKQAHEAARETEAFTKSIAPVRKNALQGVKALEMRHVRFTSRQEQV